MEHKSYVQRFDFFAMTIERHDEEIGVLQFVLVDGQYRHVSDFAHLPPKDRPQPKCPLCEEVGILKLGNIIVHHFAHQSGSRCVATTSETAIHLNSKIHLEKELYRGNKLFIRRKCDTCGYYNGDAFELIGGWDAIALEKKFGTLRPDITLLKEGQPIFAVEVCVNHPIDSSKASKLRSMGIAWIEVEGEPELYSGGSRWVAGKPLPYLRISSNSSSFRLLEGWCDYCNKVNRKSMLKEYQRERAQQRLAEIKALQAQASLRELEERRLREEHELKNGKKLLKFADVDLYGPDGRYAGVRYKMYGYLVDGVIEKVTVETGDQILAEMDTYDDNTNIFLWEQLKSLFQRRGVIGDNPRGWLHPMDEDRQFPAWMMKRRYEWDDYSKRWYFTDTDW
jgi:hypothetical protein